jgi:hypothetical protein
VSGLTFKSDKSGWQSVCVWSDSGKKSQTKYKKKPLSDFCLTLCLKSRKSTKISENSEVISPFLINFRVLLKFIKIGENNFTVLSHFRVFEWKKIVLSDSSKNALLSEFRLTLRSLCLRLVWVRKNESDTSPKNFSKDWFMTF